jgi:hypothetical protein
MTGERGERGQVAILFALLLVVIVGVGAIVVDGGYGFVQYRRAQNAADAASVAGADALMPACGSEGSVANAQVTATITDLIASNAPGAGGAWQGSYLSQGGNALTGAPSLPDDAGNAPTGACGVQVRVTPSWSPFLARIFGVTHLAAQASAAAVVGSSADAPPTGHSAGIAALASSGTHTIFGGGSGQFTVNGNIMDNSPGNCGSTPGCYADTVDDFGSSATTINGQLDSVAPVALDPCFDPAGSTSATCPNHTSGTITYTAGMYGNLPPEPDPLAYIPPPVAADTACPGAAPQTFTSLPGAALTPGVYDFPVFLTGSATLSDCSGSPGIYIFTAGLFICPGAGDAVTGSDVVLYDDAVPPGGPNTSNACGSPAKGGGPGGGATNGPDGIFIGGNGSVTLSGAQSGLYEHMLLYQDRGAAANLGLDSYSADSATIQLTGAVYDNSESGGSGGTLVSGGGSGGGNISVDGIVVVDRFATAGTANVVITYDPSQVPGVGGVLVQ